MTRCIGPMVAAVREDFLPTASRIYASSGCDWGTSRQLHRLVWDSSPLPPKYLQLSGGGKKLACNSQGSASCE